MLKKLYELITLLHFYCGVQEKHFLEGILVRKSHWFMIRDEFRTLSNTNQCCTRKPLPVFAENSIMVNRVLNRLLMITVAIYWESISNKAKILLSVLAKNVQSTFICDSGSTCNLNDGLNEKMSSCWENQTKKVYRFRVKWIHVDLKGG